MGRAMSEIKQPYTVKETAAFWRVHSDTVYRMIAANEIKVVRFGRKVMIPADEVERVARGGVDVTAKPESWAKGTGYQKAMRNGATKEHD